MAESLSRVINEEFLTCKICLSAFTQPKSLSCLHTFCLQCLEQHLVRNNITNELSCPLCRQVTQLGVEGQGGLDQLRDNFFIASLQDAVQIEKEKKEVRDHAPCCDSCQCRGEQKVAEQRCLNCQEYLCTECVLAHQRLNLTKNHMMTSPGQVPAGTDSQNAHVPGTERDLVDVQVVKHEDDIVCCTQHPVEEVKLYCEDCATPICVPCKLTAHHVHKSCDIETAISVEQGLLKRLAVHLKTRLSEYEKIKTEWEDYSTDLESQERCLVKKIQSRKEEILHGIDEWYEMLVKKTRDNYWQEKHFVSSKTSAVQKQLDTYRAVIDHLNILMDGRKVKKLLGLTSQLKDELRLNHLAEDDLSSLSLNMKMVAVEMLGGAGENTHNSPQNAIANAVELLGTVQISYKKLVQNHQRFVKKLTLVQKFQTRPSSTMFKCRFDASRLILNYREHLIITDRQLERVSLFDAGGKYRGQICTSHMGKPLSGIQLPNGDVVVIREKPSICLFSPHGRDKKIIKESLIQPCCAALGHDGNFFVLDYNQKLVMKFCSQTYTKITEIRTPYNRGSRWDKLLIKPNNHIFICAHKESCIYEFSQKGRKLGSYGRYGSAEPGELSWPRGMGLDHHGNLIVADSGNNCLQLVSPKGTWVYLQVSRGDALQCPTDVGVSSSGLISVLESTGMIKNFQYTPF